MKDLAIPSGGNGVIGTPQDLEQRHSSRQVDLDLPVGLHRLAMHEERWIGRGHARTLRRHVELDLQQFPDGRSRCDALVDRRVEEDVLALEGEFALTESLIDAPRGVLRQTLVVRSSTTGGRARGSSATGLSGTDEPALKYEITRIRISATLSRI